MPRSPLPAGLERFSWKCSPKRGCRRRSSTKKSAREGSPKPPGNRRNVLAVTFLAGILLVAQSPAAPRPVPPAKNAADYPAVDIHSAEHVAIAADPYDTAAKIAIFRVNYLKYGFIPIRIIITNDSAEAISLAGAHITFDTPAGERLQTAELSDVERRVDQIRDSDGNSKFPVPFPRIGGRSAGKRKEIEADFRSFEYSAVIVEPHTTRAGFFFYDLQGVPNPLAGATLDLDSLRNAAGKQLFYFEIPFDKYLADPMRTGPTP